MASIEGVVISSSRTTVEPRLVEPWVVLSRALAWLALLPLTLPLAVLRIAVARRLPRRWGVPRRAPFPRARQVRHHAIETDRGVVQVMEDREAACGGVFLGHRIVACGPAWGGVLRLRGGRDLTTGALLVALPPRGMAAALALAIVVLVEWGILLALAAGAGGLP